MVLRCDLAVDSVGGKKNKNIKRRITEGRFGTVMEDITLLSDMGDVYAGRYITLTRKDVYPSCSEEKKYFIRALGKAVKDLISDKNNLPQCVMIIGLGNGMMTSDALGKSVTEKTVPTRGRISVKTEVCCFPVGVGGVTGIESSEVIRGLLNTVRPDLLICVDALCAVDPKRLGVSYQITDTGLAAGSGAGCGKGIRIDRNFAGIPVVAIGVPFVVSARRLVETVTKDKNKINELFADEDLFVAPRDADAILDETSDVIAAALNLIFSAE